MNRLFKNIFNAVKSNNSINKTFSTIIENKKKRKFKPYKKKENKTIDKSIETKNNNNWDEIINDNDKKRNEVIPKRIREIVWTTYNGNVFDSKCYVDWCDNQINVFNFQVGHDIPESKGGTIDIHNLKPICGSCNLSMGNKYTITEWSKLVKVID